MRGSQGFSWCGSRVGLWALLLMLVATPSIGSELVGSDEHDSAETYLALAGALTELDRHEEAADALHRAVAIEPASGPARRQLGVVLVATGDVATGLAHLEEAIELDPMDGTTRYEAADALRRLDRWEEALARYGEAIELGALDEDSLTGEAEALLALGRYEEARRKLDEGLSVFPESRGLQFGLAWVCAASPDAGQRDGARALALAQELFTARRSLAAAELIAAARAELGRCKEAAELQRFVLQQAQSFERPPEAMARLEQALGWFDTDACRIPAGRPASERPYWPRRRVGSKTG